MFITRSQPLGNRAGYLHFSEPFMRNVNSSRTNNQTNIKLSHEILVIGEGGWGGRLCSMSQQFSTSANQTYEIRSLHGGGARVLYIYIKTRNPSRCNGTPKTSSLCHAMSLLIRNPLAVIIFVLQNVEHSEVCKSTAFLYVYIRGVTGGTDQTSGGCSLCYTIPI